jgi:arylsulfatase A-like enzyme
MSLLTALRNFVLGMLARVLWMLTKSADAPQKLEAQEAGTQVFAAAVASTPPATPNFLVFLMDDLEVDLLQRMLDAGLLPNIKSKVVEGAFDFKNAYAPCPICSPSRASLLTGKNAHNTGVWHVTGSEGPQQFDIYLASSGNAYLPTWLGPEYYRAFVGKTHLGANFPNWDFFRPVNGYDLRPGMYRANEDGRTVYPEMYQTKYIGESAKQAIRSAGGKPYFLLVAPTAVHVNVFNWRSMPGYNNNSYSGSPLSFSQFEDRDTGTWRQHLVTVEYVGIFPTYKWWVRDSQSRDSGWGAWSFAGDEETVAPGTESGNVVGWNVLEPQLDIRRQQLVRARGTAVNFFTRDLVGNLPPPWTKAADESILAGTGNLPMVAWSAITFPSGLIRQQIVRGSEVDGYVSYFRHRDPMRGNFTPWIIDPDWGETVVFGTLHGFNLIPTAGDRYIVQVLIKRPGATRFDWWQSPELVDHQALASATSGPIPPIPPIPSGVAPGPDFALVEEGEQLDQPFMTFSHQQHTLGADSPEAAQLEALGEAIDTVTVSKVHPYYLMRAYAEGSWSPVLPGQTYDWGGNYPAGSLRRNREIHGFEAASPQQDLPAEKASYNRRVGVSVPFYGPYAWPDLNDPVWGGREQEDYLRRLYLDRQEQLLSIDRMVGEVVDVAGPNTMIIFTSDNGHFNGEHRLSNKLTPQEESIRIPLYIKVSWRTGRPIGRMAANIDLAPTILQYAGKQWWAPRYNVDGRSLRPLIEFPGVPLWRRSLLVEYHRPRGEPPRPYDWRFGLPDYLGLRIAPDAGGDSANSLYVQYYTDVANPSSTVAYERYLMNADPHQTNNIATAKNPALDTLIRAFYSSSGAATRNLDETNIPQA